MGGGIKGGIILILIGTRTLNGERRQIESSVVHVAVVEDGDDGRG